MIDDEYDELLKQVDAEAKRSVDLNRKIAESHQRQSEEVIASVAALKALGPQSDELLKAVLGNQP